MNNKNIFSPSGYNDDFYFENATFSEYVFGMREIVEKSRLDLLSDDREKIIDANSPFEFIPKTEFKNQITGKYQRGILLIHGLYDSPTVMKSLADFFITENYVVRNLLLPGHGTVPGDLLNIQHSSWEKTVDFGLKSFANEVDELFVIGYSNGGLLALLAALKNPVIKKLILLAPAVKLNGYADLLALVNQGLEKINLDFKWFKQQTATDYGKYQSFTCNSVLQVLLMIKKLKETMQETKLNIPTLMAISENDETIPAQYAIDFFNKIDTHQKQLLIYTTDVEKIKLKNNNTIYYFNSVYPELSIINFSHNCLAAAKDHFHYGVNGDFQAPEENKPYFCFNNKIRSQAFGALNLKNQCLYRLHRLSYNPDFENFIKRIKDFLQ